MIIDIRSLDHNDNADENLFFIQDDATSLHNIEDNSGLLKNQNTSRNGKKPPKML